MSGKMKKSLLFFAVLLISQQLSGADSQGEANQLDNLNNTDAHPASSLSSWWDDAWNHRLVIETAPQPAGQPFQAAKICISEFMHLSSNQGDDIRVIDDNGSKINFKLQKEPESEDKHFLFLEPDESDYYYIYLGNPDAPAPDIDFKPQARHGLMMETFRLPQRIYSAAALGPIIDSELASYGKGRRKTIDDTHNPFGRNRNFLAEYRGLLYIPETGLYSLAVEARDAALFNLYSNDEVILTCSHDVAVTSKSRQPLKNVNLDKGWYNIEYYLAANTPLNLARLLWSRPSSKGYSVVPPEAFPTHLPAYIIALEGVDRDLNPFFHIKHLYDVELGPENITFSRFKIQTGDYIMPDGESELDYEWAIDGQLKVFNEEAFIFDFPFNHPEHDDFIDKLDISLKLTNENSRSAAISRPLRRAHNIETAAMDFDMEVELPVGLPIDFRKNALDFTLYFRNNSSIERPFVLSAGFENDGTESRKKELGTLSAAERWQIYSDTLQLPEENSQLNFEVKMHDWPVKNIQYVLMRTDGKLEGLRLNSKTRLVDRDETPVLLALTGLRHVDTAKPRHYSSNGKVNVVIMDSLKKHSLGAVEGDYADLLQSALEKRYSPLEFNILRIEDKPKSPASRLIEIIDILDKDKPNILVLKGLLCPGRKHAQPDEFEGYLEAVIEQVLAQSNSVLMLTTPPPLPMIPYRSRTWAHIIKKTGFQRGLAVADFYSRFMLNENRHNLFSAGENDNDNGHKLLNEKAHELMAAEILSAIRRNMNRELFHEAKKASLPGGR